MFTTPLTYKKARKVHRCTWCGEDIKVGEQYTTWKSVDDSWFTSKMHPECRDDASEHVDGDMTYEPYEGERPYNGNRN